MSLRVGDAGVEVSALHQALLERGHSISQNEIAGASFSSSTLAAILLEQRKAGITVDGAVGPKTWGVLRRPVALGEKFTDAGWRCEPSEVRAEVRQVIDAAMNDLARPTIEEPFGSNQGPLVEKYGAVVDGEWKPWCAAAASYWYNAADDSPLKGQCLLSAYKWRSWAKAAGRLIADDERPQPGDLGITVKPDCSGHVGLIVWVSADGKTLCHIEGNSKNAVRGVVRPRWAWSCIARPIPLR
jgi:hypothetical protein